ncbi:MAG: prolipoprotein diacylglyceryl transferase family protein [Coriobacteriia bacterium]|nr:prolipoprotein diacylglyceryl transferase family protein [Coriobacteriia bacterium]
MNPVLRIPLGTGTLELGVYSTFYLLAWACCPLVAAVVARRGGAPFARALGVYAGAMAAGVIGARIFDLGIAGRFYAEDPSRVWSLQFQGFSLYGGLLVAALTAIGLAQFTRLDRWPLADAAVPALVLGVALMRTGCFLRGCCFGVECALPWGVVFPLGSPAWELQVASGRLGLLSALGGAAAMPVHPTQLYEIAAAVILGGAAWVLARRGAPRGVPFLAFAFGFTAFRLLNGYLRARQQVITAPVWFYPVFYAVVLAILAVLIARRYHAARAQAQEALARYP